MFFEEGCMPIEFNNVLYASTVQTTSRRLPLEGSSAVTVMVWTVSGIVLASCGGGGGGGGGGLSVTAPSFARVVDGPVMGAAIYFDVTGGPGDSADGRITQADRVHRANVDENGAALYRTNARGEVEVPAEFANRLFVADVDGAIDTATNTRLIGEFMSLARGGIATPLTDLINREGGESQAQRVLNQIFDPGRVTLNDVLNIQNYQIQQTSQPSSLAHLVTEAALLLTEIDKNKASRSSLPDQDETRERIELLRKVISGNTNDADAKFLSEMVTIRVAAGHEVQKGTDPDVNDNRPEIDVTGQQITLNEGTTKAGTDTGYRISASDLDDPHGKPTLSVSDNRFRIDDEGKLLFAQDVTVDYETLSERDITLTITAEDTGGGGQGSPGNGTERVIIHFSNLNDNSPIIMQTDLTQDLLAEGSIAAGTDTGFSFTASDPDDPNGRPILRVSDSRFQIDEQGILRFARNVDIDLATLTNGEIQLMIIAEDTGVGTGTQPNATLPITIKIVKVDAGKAEFSITFSGDRSLVPVVGTVLTATEVTPDPDVNNAVYSYQWYHVGETVSKNVEISGATSATYTIKTADEGKQIGVRVRYAEDSVRSNGITPTTPTGIETVLSELATPIKKDIISDVSNDMVSVKETDAVLIILRFDNYTVHPAGSATKADGTWFYLDGDDKEIFKVVQDGTGVAIISTTGFDYENPADEDLMNTYVFSIAYVNSAGLTTSSTDYTLTITDDTSDNPQDVTFTRSTGSGVHSATGTVTETDNFLKITSLEDAIKAYSSINDVLNTRTATFASAVVDSDNPRQATITFKVTGQADIVFTYILSGNDVNDVILVQNGNDASVVTVSGLDYENPADRSSPPDNVYKFVETITTAETSFPSDVTRIYTLTVTDDSSEVSIEVYESHPVHKPIDMPFGDLSGFQLTSGYGDNAFFTIDGDGNLFWKATPDYETPRDGDGNSIYEIELSNSTSGQMHQASIIVKDIGIELPTLSDGEMYRPTLGFQPRAIPDTDLPTIPVADIPTGFAQHLVNGHTTSDFVQHLLEGSAWKMPETGPVIISYSISEEERRELASEIFPNDQAKVDAFYTTLEAVFSQFENAANLDFIEIESGEEETVTYTHGMSSTELSPIPHLTVRFQEGGGSHGGSGEDNLGLDLGYKHVRSDLVYTLLHEIGHGIGLKHPFEDNSGHQTFDPQKHWPGVYEYQFSPYSVMSYHGGHTTLQPADIAALQFLYGVPGTNFEGVENIIVDVP
jgi:hypothetical protein